MKKVININFQGRVIPIEEAAYDVLKQYVESLRKFFANEEGRDEIINDIEGRIAELFGERLKKGSTCITGEDVNGIIDSMGRPEDFEEEENNVKSQPGVGKSSQEGTRSNYEYQSAPNKGRLYRDDNEKILGGVCSGLAAYFRIDPTIIRLIFVLFIFSGGAGFLLYILMWAILPSRPLDNNVPSTKRLYRNPEEKVVAGVASGIATYFNIAIWIPRLIFAMPLVIGIISSLFRGAFWFDFDFPDFVFSSFGGTLFIVYAVLWAVIPEAKSASEKLEMRGEKVDLHTIKNTIQEDLEGFKSRAEKWGGEFSEKAKEFGSEFGNTVSQKGKQFGSEAAYATKSGGNKLLNAIGILFKAFFLFVAGIIAFALLIALIAVMVASVGVFPLKDFVLDGFWQNFLAWSTLLLFLFVPVVGIVIWLIRRIMGTKSHSKYLGYTFGGLWTLGIISVVFLVALISKNFDARAMDKETIGIRQPSNNKLMLKVADSRVRVVGKWMHFDGIIGLDEDSLMLNNINLRFTKSPDSLYHIIYTKVSNGYDEENALKNVDEIKYGIVQDDSMVYLNRGFSLKKGTKFRNQGVIVNIQVPIGKKIQIDPNVNRRLSWFNINNGRNDFDWDEDWYSGDHRGLSSNVEYIMTPGGLERANKKELDEEEKSDAVEDFKKSKEELQKEYERKQKEAEELKKELDKPVDTNRYRYQKVTVVEPNTAQPNIKVSIKEAVELIDLGSDVSRISLLHMLS
ncbi:MAG TPA: PspC domain-containing protein [Sediminibacterium sp.]|nr:PspC domain-containing protein [Sediminibacterium sp.]